MKRMFWWVTVATLMALTLVWPPSVVLAEDPLPPAVGAIVLEDDLSGPTLIKPSSCRSGRAASDYVGEGLRFKVTGPCNDGEIFAVIGATIRGLSMPDGEVRFEVKAVSGVERVRVGINARLQPFTQGALNSAATIPGSDAVGFEPGPGRGLIGKTPGAITERTDLAGSFAVDDWNTVAIRLQGPSFWLLLNDQAVLFSSDDSFDRGEVNFSILKTGDGPGPERSQADPNDTSEVAVVIRNLRVSALADGDPARVPTYQRP